MARFRSVRVDSVIRLGSVAGGVFVWTVAARCLHDPVLLPGPLQVFSVFSEMIRSGELATAAIQSLIRVSLGYAAGCILGIFTGFTLGTFKASSWTVVPLFDFLKGIPPIALVPLFGLWLGIGEVSKYAVIAYLVWIVVAIGTASGIRETPRIRLRAGTVLGLGRSQILIRILLPSAAPYMLIGMRNAVGFAFVALVSAELVAANAGIGRLIMDSRFSLDTARMFVGLIALGVLGATLQLLVEAALDAFEVRFLKVTLPIKREYH